MTPEQQAAHIKRLERRIRNQRARLRWFSETFEGHVRSKWWERVRKAATIRPIAKAAMRLRDASGCRTAIPTPNQIKALRGTSLQAAAMEMKEDALRDADQSGPSPATGSD